MTIMKRVLAILLTLAMLVGLMPMALAAQKQQTDNGEIRTAQEISGVSRLDEIAPEGTTRPAVAPQYDEDKVVTVIVQLDAPALMDYYEMSTLNEEEGMTAGEAVIGAITRFPCRTSFR